MKTILKPRRSLLPALPAREHRRRCLADVLGRMIEIDQLTVGKRRKKRPIVRRAVAQTNVRNVRILRLHPVQFANKARVKRLLAVFRCRPQIDRMQSLAFGVVESDGSRHGQSPAIVKKQHACSVDPHCRRCDRPVELRQLVVPGFFFRRGERAHGVAQHLAVAIGDRSAVAFAQVVHDRIGAQTGILVRHDLRPSWRRVEDQPGVVLQGTIGFPALRRLVHMTLDRDRPVGRFVNLGRLALAGQPHGPHLDRTSVGIEPHEVLLFQQHARLIEGVLDRFFRLQHGALQPDRDAHRDRLTVPLRDCRYHSRHLRVGWFPAHFESEVEITRIDNLHNIILYEHPFAGQPRTAFQACRRLSRCNGIEVPSARATYR